LPSEFEEIDVFGDVTYAFSQRFDVTAGVRYSHNSQSGSETVGGLLIGPPFTLALDSDDSAFTWLVSPRFRISDEVMAYVRVASGYRPGGPNAVVPGVPPTFAPDTVVNYEAGLKADLLDRRLTLELAAFYIDWTDVQVNLISPIGLSYLDNAGQASSRGFEAAMDWRPIDGLQVSANFAWTDATLDEDLPGPSIGFDGDRLPSIPHFAGQVSADYEFPLSGPWSGLAGASWRHVGEREGEFPRDPVTPRWVLPAYDVIDLRVGVKRDRASLTFYVRNVGDERGQISAFNLGPLQEVAVIQPRTFGVSLSSAF
jgi:outer membrane receptor protein involved in Fe transport